MQSSDICMFYLRGACRFGKRCWNSHDLTCRSPKTRALAAAATSAYYEQGCSVMSSSTSTSTNTNTSPNTSTSTSTNTNTSPNTSTSSTSTGGIPTQVQPQGLQLLLEASMKPVLKQSDDSGIEIEKVATELSVAMKTGNSKSVKETASKLHALHQKKKKESIENDNSAWSDIILCAIDNDLQCNICFEIFIKPTVLNCSHTFCESCIYVWTKRAQKCPICRVHIRSKAYCLTLDSFIEKIVEQLPKEIKHKRGATIKDRSKMIIDKPRPNNRLESIDLTSLFGWDEMIEHELSPQSYSTDEYNIYENIIIEESEVFGMNLHDIVINTGGINPLIDYYASDEPPFAHRSLDQN